MAANYATKYAAKFQSRNRESSYFNALHCQTGAAITICFNLVIENLLISTIPLNSDMPVQQSFQSRNRESSYFNFEAELDKLQIAMFQSRNRESSYFNEVEKYETQEVFSFSFQSRNRESSYFNKTSWHSTAHAHSVSIS